MMEVSMNVLLKIWLEKLTSPSGLMLLVNQNHFMKIYKQCFVSSHYRALYYQAIVQALDQTNTGSKIDEENMLPLLWHWQMDGHSSFLDKEDKPEAPSLASSLHWLDGDFNEPTDFLQGVGNVAPSVEVWPCHCSFELNWASLANYPMFIHTYIFHFTFAFWSFINIAEAELNFKGKDSSFLEMLLFMLDIWIVFPQAKFIHLIINLSFIWIRNSYWYLYRIWKLTFCIRV